MFSSSTWNVESMYPKIYSLNMFLNHLTKSIVYVLTWRLLRDHLLFFSAISNIFFLLAVIFKKIFFLFSFGNIKTYENHAGIHLISTLMPKQVQFLTIVWLSLLCILYLPTCNFLLFGGGGDVKYSYIVLHPRC